ncbi:MAG: hypothetical protein FJ363_05550 [Gemmatimonadetes bacterium]|nr:hypothetical protein [Gemmatimonadota bacterium]
MLGVAALAWLLAAPQGDGARPIVGVDVRPATVAVGEPFTVRVRVRASAGATVRFPEVPDSAGAIEALDPRAIENRSTSEWLDQTAVYRFIAWEPGRRAAPLGPVLWSHARATEPIAFTVPAVEVTTMLPADTALLQPRAARAPFEAPPQWWRWGLIAASLLAIAWMLRRAWRRRGETASAPDAFADAQASFAAVDALALADAGEPGRAVLLNAEVMRAYLARRFPQAADGLTTPEFVRALAEHQLPILPEEVAEVLDAADAVKFAGAPVDDARLARIARAARGVVRDVQAAYEARLAVADKGKGARGRRRSA